jgi:hypothetical protein
MCRGRRTRILLHSVAFARSLKKWSVFPNFWQAECSGGARRRAWKQSGLRQTLNATVSKVDNLIVGNVGGGFFHTGVRRRKYKLGQTKQ